MCDGIYRLERGRIIGGIGGDLREIYRATKSVVSDRGDTVYQGPCVVIEYTPEVGGERHTKVCRSDHPTGKEISTVLRTMGAGVWDVSDALVRGMYAWMEP